MSSEAVQPAITQPTALRRAERGLTCACVTDLRCQAQNVMGSQSLPNIEGSMYRRFLKPSGLDMAFYKFIWPNCSLRRSSGVGPRRKQTANSCLPHNACINVAFCPAPVSHFAFPTSSFLMCTADLTCHCMARYATNNGAFRLALPLSFILRLLLIRSSSSSSSSTSGSSNSYCFHYYYQHQHH